MSKKIYKKAQFLMSVDAPQKLGDSRVEVAFVGRSNVGKSSLLNAICSSRKLTKVSKTPGKTRAINIFSVTSGKWLVDLPGYGFAASVSKKEKKGWRRMIELYLSTRPMLKAVFVLVDARLDATELDREMLEWLNSIGMPCYVVANKIDRIPQSKYVRQRQKLAKGLGCSPESIGWVSAKKGTGIGALRVFLSGVLEL